MVAHTVTTRSGETEIPITPYQTTSSSALQDNRTKPRRYNLSPVAKSNQDPYFPETHPPMRHTVQQGGDKIVKTMTQNPKVSPKHMTDQHGPCRGGAI